MVPISIFDHLEIKITQKDPIRLICQGLPVPIDEKNLVFQAAQAFSARTGLDPGLSIKLTKNIPVAAGLGGGSSDAAGTLKTLNQMCGTPLTSQDLADLAVRLGADVPFFLKCSPSIARGIGEILEPIENWPQFWYVIVTPPIHISTAWVYGNLNLKLTKDEYDFIINSLEGEPLEVAGILENDLDTVTGDHFPVINIIKKSLMDAGAEGASMSGSGPSVFGIFRSKGQALSAKRHLTSQNLGGVFVAHGLS